MRDGGMVQGAFLALPSEGPSDAFQAPARGKYHLWAPLPAGRAAPEALTPTHFKVGCELTAHALALQEACQAAPA